jgi:hypothetical protein
MIGARFSVCLRGNALLIVFDSDFCHSCSMCHVQDRGGGGVRRSDLCKAPEGFDGST